MSYDTEVKNMKIGTRYILSPEVNIGLVGGGYNRFAGLLQAHYHILEGIQSYNSYGTTIYRLRFTKEHSADFRFPAPLEINPTFIPEGINPLFIPVEEVAAKKIQNLVRRKQVKQRTLEELYAPGGPGAQAAHKNFNAHMGGTRRRKHKNKKSRKLRRKNLT